MKVVAKLGATSVVGWLEADQLLTVLAINSVKTDASKFLIWSSLQDSVALFPAKDFEIQDGRVSPCWVASVDANGFVYLAPRDWHANGFWERYHDGDEDAEHVFEKNMTFILEEDE